MTFHEEQVDLVALVILLEFWFSGTLDDAGEAVGWSSQG
jgi:hypothetical protein